MLRPELTRARFWKGKILLALGETEAAHDLYRLNNQMYDVLTERTVPALSGPSEEDSDELVSFWSR
jgi:hypothetical protein